MFNYPDGTTRYQRVTSTKKQARNETIAVIAVCLIITALFIIIV